MAFDPELRQVNQEDNGNRDHKSQDQCNQINNTALGKYRNIISDCFIYYLRIIGSGSQHDGILFTLLQQHQVQSGLYFLLTGYTHIPAFLPRSVTDTTHIAFGFAVQISFGYKQPLERAFNGSLHIRLRRTDTGIQIDDSRIALRRSAEQTLTFNEHLIITVDLRGKGRVLQADIAR